MRALLLCCCLALTACGGNVSYKGPSVSYQGSPGPIAVVAVGAVMAFELAALAVPAFTVEGGKPRTTAARAHAATPDHAPDTLVLLTLTRGPAQDLPLPELARSLNEELALRGVTLTDAPGWDIADPAAFRFSRLEQRGKNRALTVALDVENDLETDGDGQRQDAVARLRLVDVGARETLAERTLRLPVGQDRDAATAHLALTPRLAEAMAAMLGSE